MPHKHDRNSPSQPDDSADVVPAAPTSVADFPDGIYRRLAEDAADIIYRYRLWPEPGFEYINPAVTALTGYTPEEHYVDPYLGLKLVHPNDRDILAEAMASTSDHFQFRVRWIRRDGGILHTEHHCTQLRDAEGRAVAVEGIARDVTAAVEAASALLHQQEILDRATDTIFTWNTHGQITTWNKGAERLYGWRVDEVRGQNLHRLLDTQFPAPLAEIMATLVRDGHWEGRLTHRRRDGSQVIVESHWSLLRDGDDAVIAYLEINSDITARVRLEEKLRASEARYRLLAENAHDVIWLRDLHGQVTYVSPSVLHQWGYTQAEFLQQSLETIFSSPSFASVRDALDTRLALARKGDPVDPQHFDVEVHCKDGSVRWVEILSSAVYDESGVMTAMLGVARDISERKRMEEVLRGHETKLVALLRNTDDRIWAVDTTYRLIIGNTLFQEGVRSAFGYELQPGDSVFVPETPQSAYNEWKGYYDRALAGEAFTVETLTRFTATPHYREYRFHPIRSDEGDIRGVVVLGRDTSARRQMEEALRVNLTKYRVLFDSSPLGISVTDDRGQVLETNREAERLLGVPKEEHERRTYDGPEWQIVRPDGTPMPASEYASVRALVEKRFVENVEMGIIKGPETITWISVSAAPLPLPGFGVVIAYTDITARKAMEEALRSSEALFRTLAQLVPVGLYLTDSHGRCQYVNERWLETAGMTLEEALGDGWVRGLHPEDRTDVQAHWQAMVAAEGSWSLEYRFQTPEGKTTWVLGLATPLRDAAGRLTGYVGANMDITERRREEEEILHLNATLEDRVRARTADLEASNAALEQAVRVKDAFLATMSHELRTPLTGVLSMAEALQEQIYGPLNERQAKSVATIQHSGHHLLELINNILELTRGGDGDGLTLCRFSAETLCQASLRMVAELAARKQQTLSLQLTPADLVMVADFRRVEQILVNLLGNAVKFTGNGGQIHLRVEGDTAAGTVTFSVEDTGIGIAATDVARIFDPFVQLDSGLNRQYSGTGLGLALVRRFAELHGGQVGVESTPGLGSRFYVVLPWRSEADATAHECD